MHCTVVLSIFKLNAFTQGKLQSIDSTLTNYWFDIINLRFDGTSCIMSSQLYIPVDIRYILNLYTTYQT